MSQPQAAAESAALIERGIELYAAGDVAGAADQWRQALEVAPHDERARGYVDWVEFQLRGGRETGKAEPPAPGTPGTESQWELDPDDGAIREELTLEPTRPWSPPLPRRGGGAFGGSDAPVRRFLARAPTTPGLLPVDVTELSDSQVAALAGPAPAGEASRLDPVDDPLSELKRALDRDQSELAVRFAEQVIAVAGGVEAAEVVQNSDLLLEAFERYLGDRRRMVKVGDQTQHLDSLSAYLMSRVDGTFSIEDLLDISGMERLSAARLVAALLRRGALV